MDGQSGVHKGLADFGAPLGHPRLCVLGGDVCSTGLVPPVGPSERDTERTEFVDALQLCPAHGLVVVCHVLAELHRHLEALRLCGMDLEGCRAAEDSAAPFFQDSRPQAAVNVSCDGGHRRVVHRLWAEGAQCTTLF